MGRPVLHLPAEGGRAGHAVAEPGKGRGQDKFVAIDLDDNLTVVVAVGSEVVGLSDPARSSSLPQAEASR